MNDTIWNNYGRDTLLELLGYVNRTVFSKAVTGYSEPEPIAVTDSEVESDKRTLKEGNSWVRVVINTLEKYISKHMDSFLEQLVEFGFPKKKMYRVLFTRCWRGDSSLWDGES